MKTTIKSIMIMLCFITTVNAAPRQPKALIAGNFISKSYVSYTLYEVQDNNDYKEVVTVANKKNYKVTFDVNVKYLLKFEDKTGKIKYLSFIAYDSADLIMDVDFKSDKSINLVYDGEDIIVTPIKEELVIAAK